MSSPFGFLLARNPPSRAAAALTATLLVALCTLIVYPLAHVAPVVSLSVVYLPAVLVVSIAWGVWPGVLTGVASAAAFDYFHLAPVGGLTINDSSEWVALAAFIVVATLASSVSEIARARTRDAEDRRHPRPCGVAPRSRPRLQGARQEPRRVRRGRRASADRVGRVGSHLAIGAS